MSMIPKAIEKLFAEFSKEFSLSVLERFLQFLIASILLGGRKTIRLLQSSGIPLFGHFSYHHRVFSHRRWSSFALSRHLSEEVVQRLSQPAFSS